MMAMKGIRIPFAGPNILAIIAGTKTQTRRIVKLGPNQKHAGDGWPSGGFVPHWKCTVSPYGKLGDTVYGTEEFATVPDITGNPGDRKVVYRCDGTYSPSWTQAMFMPVALSRCPLTLTAEPRIERLNDISEADAIAEGCVVRPIHNHQYDSSLSDPRADYRALWESIHGVESWFANPNVYVLTFAKKEGK